MLINQSQAIGTMVPIYGGGDDGSGGGQTQDHQTPAIIVGNALFGDTIFVCDVLDPGDGTGLVIALDTARTESVGDVFFRRGAYFLNSTLDVTPPADGTLLFRGESMNASVLVLGESGGATERRLLEQTNTLTTELLDIRDFAMRVRPAQTGSTGSYVAGLTFAVATNVLIEFDADGEMAFETLLAGFHFASNVRVDRPYFVRNCHVMNGPSYVRGDRVESGLFASFMTELGGSIHRVWDGCSSLGGSDIGFYGQESGTWSVCLALKVAYAGWSLTGAKLAQLTGCTVHVGYPGQTDAIMPACAYGFAGGGFASMLTNCIALTSVETESEIAFPAYDMELLGANGTVLSACASVDFTIGVFIGVGESDAIVTGCHNFSNFIAIDDNGFGSEIAINVSYPP